MKQKIQNDLRETFLQKDTLHLIPILLTKKLTVLNLPQLLSTVKWTMSSSWSLFKRSTKTLSISNNLKIMFTNLNDFTEFKKICQKDNIEHHTYTVDTQTTIVVLRRFIKFPVSRICENIKDQGFNPIHCTEILTHTKYNTRSIELPSNVEQLLIK